MISPERCAEAEAALGDGRRSDRGGSGVGRTKSQTRPADLDTTSGCPTVFEASDVLDTLALPAPPCRVASLPPVQRRGPRLRHARLRVTLPSLTS